MSGKILISSFYDREIIKPELEKLSSEHELIFCDEGRTLTKPELMEYLSKGVEIVIAAEEKYSTEIFSSCPSLKMIARDGVGLDSIDIGEATDAGVLVVNAPVVHEAVADLTLGLILSGIRKIVICNNLMRRGEWNNRDKFLSDGIEGKVLGLLGFGRIAQATARRTRPFNMELISYDPCANEKIAEDLGVELVSFERLIAAADILSIHIPLNEKTTGIIDENVFRSMKKSAWIINTSRGAVINEEALVKALKERQIAGAALDVLSTEPPVITDPIFEMENVILTPHVGSDTKNTFRRVYQSLVKDINLYFRGKLPVNAVNPEAFNG